MMLLPQIRVVCKLRARQGTMKAGRRVGNMVIKSRIAHSSRSVRNIGTIVPVGAIRTRSLAAGGCRAKILE